MIATMSIQESKDPNVVLWNVVHARARHHPEGSFSSPAQETLAGYEAHSVVLKFTATSPIDGSMHPAREKYWATYVGRRLVVLIAQQPDPPDPDCSDDLERLIRTIELKPAA